MPKKNNPARSKKFDHPKDMAASFKPGRERIKDKEGKKDKGKKRKG